MSRYLIKLSYDGGGFCGWQKQKNGRSVQSEIETALYLITDKPASVIASGRTDSGVHALAQTAHFDYAGSMSLRQILLALRSKLPEDILIYEIWMVPDDFHARYRACERAYLYLLAKSKTPFNRFYTGWMSFKDIDPDRMQALAQVLLGKHDFSSFSKDNPAVPNHICELKELSINDAGDNIEFRFRADRFLHNMVRRIVGTLVNFCRSGRSPDELRELLEQRNPRQSLVIPAPASGLYLAEVKYPQMALDESLPHASLASE